MQITSLQNSKIKNATKLWDRHVRDNTDLFLIEGYREILRAVDAQFPLIELFICPPLFLGSNEENLINKANVPTYTCSEQVFRKIAYRDRPDGLIAVAKQQHRGLNHLKLGKTPLLLIAEAIEKPGNLGTILRSADASGADALILCDKCTDLYNPNVVRASVGTLFTVPVIESNTEPLLEWLKSHHILILAATPSAKANFTEVDMKQPVAIVVGTEQLGLSQKWMDNADIQVRIPMRGVADSLNVATATTLLLYEALRQRQWN